MPNRVWVVGNSGSGKTRLAGRLARELDVPHLELDALQHRPNWEPAPTDDFRADVAAFLDENAEIGWVVDGNYNSPLGDLVLDRADCVAWLDYPRWFVAGRVVRRTFGRLLFRRELWNGNRESWRSVVDRDPYENIVLWSWTNHDVYRSRYETLSAQRPDVDWVRLTSPRSAENWLRNTGRAVR